jgi:hypothetical protein
MFSNKQLQSSRWFRFYYTFPLFSGRRALHSLSLLVAICPPLCPLLDVDNGPSHALAIQDKSSFKSDNRQRHWQALFQVNKSKLSPRSQPV